MTRTWGDTADWACAVAVAGVAAVAGSSTITRLPIRCPASVSAMRRMFLPGTVCGPFPHVDCVFRPVARSVWTNCTTSILVVSIFGPLPATTNVEIGLVGILTPAVLMISGSAPDTLVILGNAPVGTFLTTVPGADAAGRY